MASQPSGPSAHPAFQAYDPDKAQRHHRLKVLALSLVALTGFLALQAVLLSRWIAVDTRPPAWDQAIHLETAWDYKEALAHGRTADVLHPVPKPGMPPFPPLYHLALQRAMNAADPAHAALWVNFAYFVVLTLCLFGLCFHFRGDWGAAAGTVAFVCAPGVQELLYSQLVDLPVLACSAAAYWAFLASDSFAEWLPSLAFGALFGIGMLHKWSFFAYMIPCYLVGLRELVGRGRKGPVVAAWALAAVLTAPWYVMNWPLLLPRLFQASADFAVPVWQGGVFLQYFWQSFSYLGPALFFLGWIGIIVPRYRRNDEHGWMIPFWILTSYVFWAIVPNRQFRFLLPGLPGLAVLATGSWPTPLIVGLLVFQLFGVVDYSRGWLSPITIPMPFGSATIFQSDPAKHEDWRIDDILIEASKRSDPGEPVADVALVANAQRFNGPTFNWRLRSLGAPRLHMRGVNKRLCELDRFVVVKGGELGPPSVIGDLPKAVEQIKAPGGWFSRGYAKAAAYPLPDGSTATLYERAKPSAPPFRAKGPVPFQFYEKGELSAEAMRVDLGKFDAAEGVYPKASVTAQHLSLRGLELGRVGVELEGLLAVPVEVPPGDEWDDVRLLKLKTLRIDSLELRADALRAFLEKRAKGLKLDKLTMETTVKAEGSFRGVPLAVEIKPELQTSPRALRLTIVSLRLSGNAIPVAALNRIKELTIPLEPNPETPFTIELPGLTVQDGRLTIP